MKQKKFSKHVVGELKQLVDSDNQRIIDLYRNKKEFQYDFTDSDIDYCDFKELPSRLGDNVITIFINNLVDSKSNDFRVSDFECAKYLYENIPLTPRQASDNHFWSYLHHTTFYRYIHTRWNEIENPSRTTRARYIATHWLMHLSSQKNIIIFPLSSLWWAIHLTIDEDREDKYELSEVYFQNNRMRTVSLGGSSFVRHKEALIGILEYILDSDITPTDEVGNQIAKFVNRLGGTKPLTYFDRNWFKSKLNKRFGDEILTKHQSKQQEESKLEFLLDNGTLFDPDIMPGQSINNQSKSQEIISPDNKSENITSDKVIKYFNLNLDGTYFLSNKKKENIYWSIPLLKSHQKGNLLICYNEEGNINMVKMKSVLKKTRELYKNGIYSGNTISTIMSAPKEFILGIYYTQDGKKFFKACNSKQLKQNNSTINLKGRQKLYMKYDSVRYKVLPIDLLSQIKRLVMKSPTAGGKLLSNSNYNKEFSTVSKFWPKIFN